MIFMTTPAVQVARESFGRCRESPDFLDRFYAIFMDSSGEIRDKFAHTDFDKQKKVLSDSIFLMLSAAGADKGFAHGQLKRLAKRHSRGELDIKPEWYTVWLDCLIATVAEKDPEFTEEVDVAWREALAGGIDLLIRGY